MKTERELRRILKAAVAGNISKWARAKGLEKQRGNISEMVHGNRKISEAVAEVLGFERPDAWIKTKQK